MNFFRFGMSPPYRGLLARCNIDNVYETFEHTADLGLRVRAPNLNTLFAEAGRALFAVIVEDLNTLQPRRELELRLQSDDLEYLFFDWLRELLYLFDSERLLLGRFDVSVTDSALSATVSGEPMDPARHVMLHEVKAITYHGLTVEQTREGWLAEVIVDI